MFLSDAAGQMVNIEICLILTRVFFVLCVCVWGGGGSLCVCVCVYWLICCELCCAQSCNSPSFC